MSGPSAERRPTSRPHRRRAPCRRRRRMVAFSRTVRPSWCTSRPDDRSRTPLRRRGTGPTCPRRTAPTRLGSAGVATAGRSTAGRSRVCMYTKARPCPRPPPPPASAPAAATSRRHLRPARGCRPRSVRSSARRGTRIRLERVRQLEPEPVRRQIVLALSGAPGHGPKRPPGLLQQQRQMPVLQLLRRRDQVHRRGAEHRLRVGRAERAQPREPATTSPEISRRPSGASIRRRGTRSSGLRRSLAQRRQPPAQFVDAARPRASRRPPAGGRRTAGTRRRTPRGPPAGRTPGCSAPTRAPRRPRSTAPAPACGTLHELRRHDADDAAVPALAGHDEDVLRADLRVACRSTAAPRPESPPPAPGAGCSRRTAVAPGPARGSRAASSRPRSSSRSSARSGELMRPAAFSRGAEHEADVEAVERAAGQPALVEQRLEPRRVRPGRQPRQAAAAR